jgi:hypothetical protein
MSLIGDVSTKLINAGYATAAGTDLFAYLFPQASQMNSICIIPYAGSIPDEVQGGEGVDYPGVQIQVRNSSLQTASETAESIRLDLNNITQGDHTLFAARSFPVDLTNPDDVRACQFRFSVDFATIKAR